MTADPKKAARAALYIARKTFADGGDAEQYTGVESEAELKPYRVSYRGRMGQYNPNYYDAIYDPLFDENNAVLAHIDRLQPRKNTVSKFPVEDTRETRRGIGDTIYRGMSHEEYENFRKSGRIQSSGNYNIGDAQKGLTYFTTSPSAAESYASSFAPEKHKPTFNRPAYIVAVKRPADKHIKQVPGTGEHEIGVTRPIEANEVKAVYRGNVVAYDPGESNSVSPTPYLHWEKVPHIAKATGGATDDDAFTAYHGTPHEFEPEPDAPYGRFRDTAIGSGEGAQAFGYGHYLAGNEGIAKHYRDALTSGAQNWKVDGKSLSDLFTSTHPDARLKYDIGLQVRNGKSWQDAVNFVKSQYEGKLSSKRTQIEEPENIPHFQNALERLDFFSKNPLNVAKNKGHLLETRVRAKPEHFLDWDKPLSEQHPSIQEIARTASLDKAKGKTKGVLKAWREGRDVGVQATGKDLHHALSDYGENSPAAAAVLHAAGIPGIRYLDASSRGPTGAPTHNYVVFDPKNIDIVRRYAQGGEVYSNHAPRHTMQSPAVAELKHLLTMHRDELRSMKGRTQYAAIDGIMKRISHEHGIAPSKLHDDWMSVYHQTPDAWVAGDHGNVVDRALKMTNRGGYAFGGSPAGFASATGAPINFAPAAGAFTGLPSPGTLNLAPSKATMAAILASRPTTHTGSGKPVELSRYVPPSIAAPTFNASSYNLPDNPLEEGQGGGAERWHPDMGGNGFGGGIGGGGPSAAAAAEAAAEAAAAESAARGGRIHRADGGEIPQEILNRIVSPFSGNEEQVKRALEIAQGYKTPIGNVAPGQTGAYYSIKHPMGASEVSTKIKDIPGVALSPKREMSWEDLYREGKGGSFINVGGDRSNLGRLTHINNKKLAWPIDLHAGAKYMMEPNPGSVWANNVSHATGFRNAILRAAEKGPVYGIYAPMGPMSVDSSHNMFDAVMAQIPGSNISKENIQKFNDDIKEARHLPASYPDKDRVKEIMQKWPGLENPKEASLFARGIGGVHRAAIIKHMDKASWHKLGFPAIGMTRAAITDPEVFNAPGNVIGHRVVKFNPENIVGKETAMPHSTYTHPTAGEYIGDIPFVQRHYAMPDVIEQLVRKTTKKGEAIHPYSIDPLGRATFRKMTEENKQIQPINQRMLDSTQLGLKRQSDYGLKNGGSAKSLVDIALNLTKGKK